MSAALLTDQDFASTHGPRRQSTRMAPVMSDSFFNSPKPGKTHRARQDEFFSGLLSFLDNLEKPEPIRAAPVRKGGHRLVRAIPQSGLIAVAPEAMPAGTGKVLVRKRTQAPAVDFSPFSKPPPIKEGPLGKGRLVRAI